jgi:hypothetical protein
VLNVFWAVFLEPAVRFSFRVSGIGFWFRTLISAAASARIEFLFKIRLVRFVFGLARAGAARFKVLIFLCTPGRFLESRSSLDFPVHARSIFRVPLVFLFRVPGVFPSLDFATDSSTGSRFRASAFVLSAAWTRFSVCLRRISLSVQLASGEPRPASPVFGSFSRLRTIACCRFFLLVFVSPDQVLLPPLFGLARA